MRRHEAVPSKELVLSEELKQLVNRKTLPKEKTVRRKIANRHFVLQQSLLLPFINPALVMVLTSRIDPTFLDEMYKLLVQLLSSAEKKTELYMLDIAVYRLISDFLMHFETALSTHMRAALQDNKKGLAKRLLMITAMLQNHFCVYEKYTVERIDLFDSIQGSYIYWATLLLGMKEITPEELVELSKCQKANEEFIGARTGQQEKKYQELVTVASLGVAAKIAYRTGDVAGSKKHLIECIRIMTNSENKELLSQRDVIEFGKQFSILAYAAKHYTECLMWLRLTMEVVQFDEQFILGYESGVAKIHDGTVPEIDVPEAKAVNARDKKNLAEIKKACKAKLKENFESTLKEVAASTGKRFAASVDDHDCLTLALPDVARYIPELVRELRKHHVVCVVDAAAHTVILHNAFHFEIAAIEKIIRSWSAYIDRASGIEKANEVSAEAELVQAQPVSHIIQAPASVAPEPSPAKKKRKEKKESTAPDISAARTEVVARVPFSEHPRYPLHGDTAHHLYVTIEQTFFSQLSEENPLAARRLVSMCERGKVINQSKGMKGIIVTTGKADEKILKFKNPKHDARFFAHKIGEERNSDGETCQLFSVDQFVKKAHKK